MKSLIVAAVAAFLLGDVTAFAGSRSNSPAAPPAPASWGGWYVGASGGYGFGPDAVTIDPLTHAGRDAFVSHELGDTPKGFLGGVTLGVNEQWQSIVAGIETDISYAAIGARVAGPFLIAPDNFQTTDTQRLNALGTLRLRLGYVLPGGSLVYATGGLAYGHAELTTFAIDTSANICGGPVKFCTLGSTSKWTVGGTGGAGWEVPLTGGWTAKVEYLYYQLNPIRDFMTDGLAPPENFQGSVTVKGNIVRVGLDYLFDKR